ncbi:hypothetical protein [Pilimelia columellifera]|uniref:Transmembrane protein n=1 Tax=Pilimelia columellifera subsp. columellifera TaxID=706583 RepID=A0ABN3NKL4_9ACTN
MLLKYVWNRYGAVAIGVLFIALGVMAAANPAPECDGVLMRPGDSCIERGKYGRERINSYDDKQRHTKILRVAAPAAGGVLIVVGVTGIVRQRRKTSKLVDA